MKISVKINKNKLSNSLKLNTGTIIVRFQKVTHHGSGMLATELAKELITGYSDKFGNKVISIPPRPLFKEYATENKDNIKNIVKSSYALRFKKIKAEEQFNIASKLIAGNLAQWIIEGHVAPANSKYTQKIKGFNAPFYSTGELVSLLEGVYVHKS